MLRPCLILVLGVNSIERNAQEGVPALGVISLLFTYMADMLLVLFNAAISNLVFLWNLCAMDLVSHHR